ncbi:MAG TPA: hypothetical protein DCG57_01500, partial [Candidatus Riflebacteria bacterium]|nr:hypothetical protein [Candidatus Riflebacteria bacterium]
MKNKTQEASRITLMVHQGLSAKVIELFTSLGLPSVLVENARCVRQNMDTRFWGLPGLRVELSDAATEIYRTTVPREAAISVTCKLIEGLELRTPGRGAVYTQDLIESGCRTLPEITLAVTNSDQLLHDLALITGIQ